MAHTLKTIWIEPLRTMQISRGSYKKPEMIPINTKRYSRWNDYDENNIILDFLFDLQCLYCLLLCFLSQLDRHRNYNAISL